MVDGRGDEETRLRQERRRALIERLNANDEYLRKLEGRRRDAGQLSEEELAREIETERERNLSRLGFGQVGGGGASQLRSLLAPSQLTPTRLRDP